jgi:hypothetical protein
MDKKWTLDHLRGEEELIRRGICGKAVFGNAIQIVISNKYNGSGPEAFGGSRTWPYVSLEFPFPEGEEAKAKIFMVRLAEFVQKQQKLLGLEP